MNISEACEYFFVEQQLRGNSAKTLTGYKGFLSQFVSYLESIKVTEIEDITLLHVNKYHLFLRSKKNNNNAEKGISSQSVRTYLRHIKVFLRFCHDKEFTEAAIHTKLILPKASAPEIEILTDDEIKVILETFSKRTELGLRNTAIVCLMLDCGLRVEEVTRIKVSDINFEKGYMCVLGKGQKGRIIPLGLKMRRVLLDYVYKRRLAHQHGADGDEYFFLTKNRRRMTVTGIKAIFGRLKVRAGIPRLHAHLLRHTFATNFLLNGLGDIYELSRVLGHADVKITEKYLHIASYYKIIEKRRKQTYLDMMK